MKHHFLTACAIAIGSLATGATGAFAQLATSADVTFTNVGPGVLSFCLAVPTPGTLGQSDNTSTTLTSDEGTKGLLVLTCNVDPILSVGNDISQLTGTTQNFNTKTASLSTTDPGAGIQTVEVGLSVTTDDEVIETGLYSFNVPVTITYN